MGEVLQKVLMPWLSQAVGDRGYPYLGGPVTRLADISHVRTARDLVAAYELGRSAAFVEDPDFVDVVRFEVEPLMRLRAPSAVNRPWPTYPMGFLTGSPEGPVPVWVLERTRAPRGAEMWRIHRSGEQELLTVFDGIARGWRSARGFTPMTHLVGPRAEFEGREYAAEFTEPSGGQVELVHIGDDVPDGFEPIRPMVSARTVLSSQCSAPPDPARGRRHRAHQGAGGRARVLRSRRTHERARQRRRDGQRPPVTLTVRATPAAR